MRTYIVAFSTLAKNRIHPKDHYVVFCDGKNKKKAKKYYKEVLKREDLHSANLCKLKKTTEHYE